MNVVLYLWTNQLLIFFRSDTVLLRANGYYATLGQCATVITTDCTIDANVSLIVPIELYSVVIHKSNRSSFILLQYVRAAVPVYQASWDRFFPNTRSRRIMLDPEFGVIPYSF